ncbi:Short-chain dehydrogenase/reductase family protein [Mycena chlorophos]|uniref:Short-chain dehydrogenase/reductase family protein n=1 Tax=Mycena chlorophos TaxID=658473 RepID=A0A8H6W5E8_MYCCL|nr:Short-chain dehydrogenase/reductase family protein [Mycena chlorophos]
MATTLPTFSASTTSDEVVDTFADDIKGKNVLVTGTSLNGLGFETARAIAKYANLVVITGYNEQRLQASKTAILEAIPSANVRTLTLDLSSLAAVRKAAAEVNAYAEPLHLLINNAAATSGFYRLTDDNIEIQMAASHIGPFLFTNLLLPKIIASGTRTWTPRVVFVSSNAHRRHDGIPLDDKEAFLRGGPGLAFNAASNTTGGASESETSLPLMRRYAHVKSANVLTARELARRGKGKLLAYSLHPGGIWTNACEGGLQSELIEMGVVNPDGTQTEVMPGGVKWKTLPQGAATTLVAAFDPRITDQSGAYLDDCVVAEDHVAPHSADMSRALKLWQLTEEVVGEKFDF